MLRRYGVEQVYTRLPKHKQASILNRVTDGKDAVVGEVQTILGAWYAGDRHDPMITHQVTDARARCAADGL